MSAPSFTVGRPRDEGERQALAEIQAHCFAVSAEDIGRGAARAGADNLRAVREGGRVLAGLGVRATRPALRSAGPDDFAAVEACYSRFARERDGYLDRGAYIWARVREPRHAACWRYSPVTAPWPSG